MSFYYNKKFDNFGCGCKDFDKKDDCKKSIIYHEVYDGCCGQKKPCKPCGKKCNDDFKDEKCKKDMFKPCGSCHFSWDCNPRKFFN